MNVSPHGARRANPVFWIMWILPGATVVAGLATVVIAVRGGDRALPASYHWEGEQLDRDFARARNAADHGIEVTFAIRVHESLCTATLRKAPGNPPALNLLLANGSDPGLDRAVRLVRVAPGEYRAPCTASPAGRWRVALSDEAGEWLLRATAAGDLGHLELRARQPGGPAS